MAEDSVMETVDSLLTSLENVEQALEPLLSKSLQDSLDGADGPLERAKILFWIAYTIHSCTWAFTKTAAVDAEDHGVMGELERIKQYNGKIAAAAKRGENKAGNATPSTNGATEVERKRLPLDKEAASRFIKAGIANQPVKPSDSSSFYSAEATVNDPLAGPGRHSKSKAGPGRHSRLKGFARLSSPSNNDDGAAKSSSSSSNDGDEDLKVYNSMVASTSAPAPSASPSAQASAENGTSIDSPTADALSQVDEEKKKRRQEKKRKRLLGANDDSAGTRKTLLDPLQGYDQDGPASQSKKTVLQANSDQDGGSKASSVTGLQTDSSVGVASGSGQEKKKRRKRK